VRLGSRAGDHADGTSAGATVGWRGLLGVSGGLLLVAAIGALQNWSLDPIPKHWFVGAGVLGILAALGLSHPASPIQRNSTTGFLIMVSSLLVMLRVDWVLLMPTLPVSDFLDYYNSAANIARGQFTVPYTQEVGYPFLLSILFRIGGPSLVAAKLLNVVLSLGTGLLLFWIADRTVGSRAARIVVVLFAVWPAQIMMNSVLASEALYMLLLLAAIGLLLDSVGSRAVSLLGLFNAGAMLGLSNTVRAVSILVLGVGLVWVVLASRARLRQRLAGVALFAVGFGLVVSCYLYVRWAQADVSPLKSSFPQPLLTGTNIEEKGVYNDADEKLYDRLVEEHGDDRVSRIVMGIVWDRIRANPGGFGRLLVQKFPRMWADDLYGAEWSQSALASSPVGVLAALSPATLSAVPQLYYVWLLALAAGGCCRLLRGRPNTLLTFLLLIFLTMVLLHSVVEVQSRYHYPWTLVFLILAGAGLVGSGE